MKILLLGSTGQVGFELKRSLAPLGDIVAPKRLQLDLESQGSVEDYLEYVQPQLIVNAAAYTAVDKAESEQQRAFVLNAQLPETLSAYCAKKKAQLVHYSSDYVYSGEGTTAWSEQDSVEPKSVYGKSKAEGDRAISASGVNALIFRTSWVYSARGQNFMKTMMRLATERESLNIVDDQVGSPTPARFIAQVTTLAIYNNLSAGIYHLAPRGEISWCAFAKAIFEYAREFGAHSAVKHIIPILTQDYPTPAIRPLNSRLATNKLESKLGITLARWDVLLRDTLEEYIEKA